MVDHPAPLRQDAVIDTFGIEEEFFVVSPATRQAVLRVPDALLADARARIGDTHVTAEILQSQIEIVSPVFTTGDEARVGMNRLRRGLAESAAGQGLAILAAGTHPLSAWSNQSTTREKQYERLIDDFQILGRRNVLCAMHVHVGIEAGIDRVDLMNRMMRWVPVFLALSTSSPFWNRERTGLMSYRQAAHDEWPRTGIPDFHESEQEYGQLVDLLVRSGAIDSAQSIWWVIRPSAHLPTLELRICDSCTEIDDTLAIAALFRCVVRAHVRRPTLGLARTNLTRRLIDENRWRAKRYGIEADFIDEQRESSFPFRSVLAELRLLIAEDVRALDCASDIAHLDVILRRGTSAHRQLGVYRQRIDAGATRLEALRDVVDLLVEATLPTESRRSQRIARVSRQ